MSKIKYFYVRQPDCNTKKYGHRGTPIACVAYKVTRCRDIMQNNDMVTRVQYALATVSDRPDEHGWIDQFDKYLGRLMATSRLLYTNGQESEHMFTESEKSSDITADIMFALYSDSLTPSRVRKAAKQWLWPNNSKDKLLDFVGCDAQLDCCNTDCHDTIIEFKPEKNVGVWQSVKNWFKPVFS